MANKTKIQWSDSTWSPWRGCTHTLMPDGTEHPGCLNCYAEALAKRNPKVLGQWGTEGTRVVNANWKAVLAWNKAAEKEGKPRFVFPSLCDPFEDFDGWVLKPNGDVLIDDDMALGGEPWTFPMVRSEFMRLMKSTPWIIWILLTKRPQNVRKYLPNGLTNVWLLTSVSDQATADAMIPDLLRCRDRSPVLGVSIEPLLGPLDITRYLNGICFEHDEDFGGSGLCQGHKSNNWLCYLDWVIVGGESGPHSRHCYVEWIRDLIGQCHDGGFRDEWTPIFVKQLGSNPWMDRSEYGVPVGALKTQDRKGGDPSEWPEDLRVREMPLAT